MDPYIHAQDERHDQIERVLWQHRDFACGLSHPSSVADAWTSLGFTAAEVDAWLNARCFDADAANALRRGGYTPKLAAERTDRGLGAYEDTIGFKVSNGDLDPEPRVEDL
jgi:hypothetical protein